MLSGVMLVSAVGCRLVEVCHEPVVHNPFPQLSRVAVAPFFNLSDEPTVDGRRFAMAYFAELQETPGYEVVPLGVVEEAILAHHVDLSDAGEARRLANILGVDAVVIGSVTDYSPYYPPRCGLRVEWYAANSGFHAIPPGYGLPWGTPQEEFIPQSLVFEAEMALAKAQLTTQTPNCPQPPSNPPRRSVSSDPPDLFAPVPLSAPGNDNSQRESESENGAFEAGGATSESSDSGADRGANDSETTDVIRTSYDGEVIEEELPVMDGRPLVPLPPQALQSQMDASVGTTVATGGCGSLPPGWPDESSFIPLPPSAVRPPCMPYNGPVMTHTRIYRGTDPDFTRALETYYYFRHDKRFGGWQNYLQRTDDFIRFCCHIHISEMLSARGGADETRVVWRWSDCR